MSTEENQAETLWLLGTWILGPLAVLVLEEAKEKPLAPPGYQPRYNYPISEESPKGIILKGLVESFHLLRKIG